MPTTKEFTIPLEDRPGTLGKVRQALAEQSVNILAYQQFPHEKGKGTVRLVVDNPAVAKSILDRQKTDYTETEVAKVTLAHRPGELARAAARLGQAGINIDYGYCGVDPSTRMQPCYFSGLQTPARRQKFWSRPPLPARPRKENSDRIFATKWKGAIAKSRRPLRLHFDRAGTLTVLAFYRELFAGLSTTSCLRSSVQISLFVGTITAEEIFGQCEGSFCLSLSSAIHSSRIAWCAPQPW